MAQVAETALSRREARGLSLTAADLPALMSVPDPRGPYRVPLLQFIWDWNVASDKAALVREAPLYDGDDPNLLPSIGVVVHALADRDEVPVPDWVAGHRAPADASLRSGGAAEPIPKRRSWPSPQEPWRPHCSVPWSWLPPS